MTWNFSAKFFSVVLGPGSSSSIWSSVTRKVPGLGKSWYAWLFLIREVPGPTLPVILWPLKLKGGHLLRMAAVSAGTWEELQYQLEVSWCSLRLFWCVSELARTPFGANEKPAFTGSFYFHRSVSQVSGGCWHICLEQLGKLEVRLGKKDSSAFSCLILPVQEHDICAALGPALL